MPSDWAAAFAARSVTLPGGGDFIVDAVAGNSAYGEVVSAAGMRIAAVDMATGRLTTIAPVASGAAGLGWMSVDPPWVVWEQGDSPYAIEAFSIHAWNQTTHARFQVAAAGKLPDGRYVPGQQPLPVVRNGVAAWAQPIPSPAGYVQAEVRLTDLGTRKQSTVASGRVSSPVFAGPYLVWGEISNDKVYSLHAIDAATRQPVTLPERVSHPASITYLAGSPEYLVWTSQDRLELFVWQIGTAHYLDLVMPDTGHYFQFLQVVSHFVLWYGGTSSPVLDLNTGNAFDVQGTVSGSAELIVAAQHVGTPNAKGAYSTARLSSVATGSAPTINSCRP